MARINAYDDAHDNLYWVVERNDGEARKSFYSREEAEIYRDRLQYIENQEKAISQNETIIANQQKILNKQPFCENKPRQKPLQWMDPEYAEWLRFKKESDPEFIKWKENEIKKRKEADEKRKQQELERQREELKRKQEQSIKEMNAWLLSWCQNSNKLRNYFSVFTQVSSIFNKLNSINFTYSRSITYETKDGDFEFFSINANFFPTCFFPVDSLKELLLSVGNINSFMADMTNLAKRGEKYLFDEKKKIVENAYKQFEKRYICLLSQARFAVERSYYSPSI